MTIFEFSAMEPVVKSYIEGRKHGIFLFDLLPQSNLTIYHNIKLHKKKSNGIIILGNDEQLEFFAQIIYDKLLSKERRDGYWSGLIADENKLFLVYNFYKYLSINEIIELLSLKFRNDLLNICELTLSELSFLQVKIDGRIINNFPLPLNPEQKLTTSFSSVQLPDTIIH